LKLFTALNFGSNLINDSSVLQHVATGVMTKWGMPFIIVNVHRERSSQCADGNMSTMGAHKTEDTYNKYKIEPFTMSIMLYISYHSQSYQLH
jgi:hypothetical protein